jgi:S1-C subfamily serine protease
VPMYRAACLGLLFFALGATAPMSARDQTFVVQCMQPNGKASVGAGVLIARDRESLTIVTAAHAITTADALRILDTTRRSYYDVLDLRTLPDYDLAIIRVRAQAGFTADAPRMASPATGEAVWLWGHPGDGFWLAASGSVLDASAQLRGEVGNPRITIACAECAHGDSGSGVFDAQGRLLGILTKGWIAPDGSVRFLEVEPVSVLNQTLVSQH